MGLRILLCVDGSPFSTAAAKVALSVLASLEGGELVAMHVVNVVPASGNLLKDLPGRLGFEPAVVPAEIEEQHADAGRTLLGDVKQMAAAAGLQITTVLEHGAVVERIAHHARRFDLLVMGLRGETEARFPGQGGGSVHNVLSQVDVPALLVPRGADRIIAAAVGYDGSAAAQHAVSALRTLVSRVRVPVHAIYVGADPGGALDEVTTALPNTAVTHHVVDGEAVHELLARQAQAVGANLLAVGFQGHSRLKDFVYGSATEFIVGNTDLILLIAH